MFRHPCELSKYIEILATNILDLERKSKVWKVKETSITDVIIANFMANSRWPWLKVDASHEATTNADFEVIFRSAGKDLTLLLQAKRTSATRSGHVTIPEAFHPRTTGEQNKELIAYADANRMIALYAVFLSSEARSSLSALLPLHALSGVMIQNARVLRSAGFHKPRQNTLKAHTLLDGSIPFHSLFCGISRFTPLIEIAAKLSIVRTASLDTEAASLLTDSISFEQRRARESGVDFGSYARSETFRILIDLDQIQD